MAAMGTKWQLGYLDYRDYLQSGEAYEADNRVAILEAYAHLPFAFNSAAPLELAEEVPENGLDAESHMAGWLHSIRSHESEWL